LIELGDLDAQLFRDIADNFPGWISPAVFDFRQVGEMNACCRGKRFDAQVAVFAQARNCNSKLSGRRRHGAGASRCRALVNIDYSLKDGREAKGGKAGAG
jgi:hypothetical protein